MDRALRNLIRISKEVGKDTSLVQGGGGNTSVKAADGRHMFVKASGTALKDMDPRRGWRRLRLDSVLAILDEESLAGLDPVEREGRVISLLRAACDDDVGDDSRPSVESHLHALLGRCVIHLHPVAVGAYVCARRGREKVARLFRGEDFPPLWVPYGDPGYRLAVKVRRLVGEYVKQHGGQPSVLFLEKHGILVAADSADEALERVRRTIAICKRGLRQERGARPKAPDRERTVSLKLAIRRGVFESTGRYAAVRHYIDRNIAGFLARKDATKLLASPALTPDEFAYASGPPLWVEDADGSRIGKLIKRQLDRGERAPASFLAPGVGLFVTGTDRTIPTIRDVVAASLQIRAAAAGFGGPRALNRRQREFIASWEMESFRRRVAGMVEGGELTGQVAVVTGAGSGLGRSIALGLARAGASVAIADVDLQSAGETVALIGEGIANGSAAAVRCDVTREKAVEDAFASVLERWGGLDILVNAAGIAPAHPLVDLPVEEWRAALEVNLTGYFLMARAAARTMIRQGMGGSIINLSSKSGVEASRNNTPYNATKAGELHMARGWALELGEHGIRVNSVAPGNVFEGSKIWSPEYIRVCAEKYGIEPEEVIPYYIDKTALKRDITGRDVADAIVFLCSDKARTITGQTLVADGGQVMVR